MSQNIPSFDPVTALFVAVPAVALASIGGIGVVGGGIAFGLSSLELGAIGAAGGYGARQALKKQTKRPTTPAPRPTASKKPKVDWDAAMHRSAAAPSVSAPSEPTEIDDLRSGRF